MRTQKRMTAIAAAAMIAATLALPALASGHATVSPMQPQGKALTSARTSYVVRAPNERHEQDTYRIVLFVPPAIQEGISVKREPGWRIRLAERETGKTDDNGEPIHAVRRISWTAKKGNRIKPRFFGEWFIRFQNPATAQQLPFGIQQWYTPKRKGGKPEIVRWSGGPGSETPASVVDVVEE